MSTLATQPKYFRSPVAKGGQLRVDREGGYSKAGLIRGVSVITKGEALGHGLWIDETTLEQVDDAINASAKGIKSRFTHPGMSGDGLGKFVGRVSDSHVAGDKVVADQHFSTAGHSTPDGDLAGYLMTLAEDAPEAYGLSIVFGLDYGAMERFQIENKDADGVFHSPDPANTNNYPHVRLADLRAVDAVDEPAANPAGLFHRDGDIPAEAEALAAYALGLSDVAPEVVTLGLNPDRVRGFVERFKAAHHLEIRPMADENKTQEQETPVAELSQATAEAQPVNDTADVGEQAEAPQLSVDPRAEVKRFMDAFGANGATWYAEGKSFEDCFGLHSAAQAAEIAELKQKLSAKAAATEGENSPVDFEAGDKPQRKGPASVIKFTSSK